MLQHPDHTTVFALTHGSLGLLTAYLVVFVPAVFGLARGKAPLPTLLLSPLLAVILTIAAGLANSIIGLPLRAVGIDREGVLNLVIGIAVTGLVGYWGGRLLARRATNHSSHRRGAVVSNAPLGDLQDRSDAITLAGIPVAPEDETKHFKFIGTTGTGKSTAIREVLSGALARGDRAVIADPDGGYLNNFYDAGRGDVILNPFDPDSVKWSLLSEIQNDYDADQLARSLIPDNHGSDRTWPEFARTFFAAVINQAMTVGVKDDNEIYRLLTVAGVKELRTMLAPTPAGPFLHDGNERMFGSLRSVATSAVAALRYTCRQRAAPFSIREWVRLGAARLAGGRGGVLFIPYKANEIAALRSVISAWMRLAIFEAMNRGEGDQRLWFIVDELDALGEIDGLKDALARLRKFGGRSVLGFQSIAQVSGTYGKGAADTIVENCGNTLILRCSASEQGGTSQFASRLIGQREVMHTTRSSTRKNTEWFESSITTSQHIGIEPAVMASEVERLADLEGYLKFASGADWRKVRLRAVQYPMVERATSNTPADAAETEKAGAVVILDGMGGVGPPVGDAGAVVKDGGTPVGLEPKPVTAPKRDGRRVKTRPVKGKNNGAENQVWPVAAEPSQTDLPLAIGDALGSKGGSTPAVAKSRVDPEKE